MDGLHLQTHFQAMGLPQDAQRFLLVVYEAWQVFDDFADGDAVKREDLNATLWNVFVGLPSNPFSKRIRRRWFLPWERAF